MEGRQNCQWDKDSCADAGFLKIDLLGLGMLSAVEECVEQIALLRGKPIDLSRIPLDDPGVYREIQDADTVGLFQIESRAQMQSLLRTRAREPRRPHDPGGARPPRADPGQGRAPVHRAAPAPARGPRLRAALRPPVARRAAARDARRDHLPGAGARRGRGARRLHGGGGRGAAAGDEPQAEPGRDGGLPAPLPRGRARQTAPTSRPPSSSSRSSPASPPSASPSRTRPPSRSWPTSRPGSATTTRRSSSARS